MNRLQKKCLLVSTGLHGLLLGVLLFGSAFVAAKPDNAPNTTIFHVIDSRLITDAESNPGGASSAPAPQPPAIPPAEPPSAPPIPPTRHEQPVRPVVAPLPPVPKPQRVRPEELQPVQPESPSFQERPELPKRHSLSADDLKIVKSSKTKPVKQPKPTDNPSVADDLRAAAEAARLSRLRREIGSAVRNLDNNFSHETRENLGGTGEGVGQASINYRDAVASIYTGAWVPPADLDDELATATVSVTIDRDGTVQSARIIQGSGNPGMDQSVQSTLDRVTFIAPFPQGAKEQTRTYTIKFNLRAKRA